MSTPWMRDHWIQHAKSRAERTPALKPDVRRHLADALRVASNGLPRPQDHASEYAWVTDLELVAYSDGSTWRAIETDAAI
jgi:hypothetical protein